jgi:hypothetical protein
MAATLKSLRINGRHGGARRGAGRKPSELTVAFREFFEGDLDALLSGLRSLALGQYREDERRRIYLTAPDRASICYILDRLLGRMRDAEPPLDLTRLLTALRGTSDGTADPPAGEDANADA